MPRFKHKSLGKDKNTKYSNRVKQSSQTAQTLIGTGKCKTFLSSSH